MDSFGFDFGGGDLLDLGSLGMWGGNSTPLGSSPNGNGNNLPFSVGTPTGVQSLGDDAFAALPAGNDDFGFSDSPSGGSPRTAATATRKPNAPPTSSSSSSNHQPKPTTATNGPTAAATATAQAQTQNNAHVSLSANDLSGSFSGSGVKSENGVTENQSSPGSSSANVVSNVVAELKSSPSESTSNAPSASEVSTFSMPDTKSEQPSAQHTTTSATTTSATTSPSGTAAATSDASSAASATSASAPATTNSSSARPHIDGSSMANTTTPSATAAGQNPATMQPPTAQPMPGAMSATPGIGMPQQQQQQQRFPGQMMMNQPNGTPGFPGQPYGMTPQAAAPMGGPPFLPQAQYRPPTSTYEEELVRVKAMMMQHPDLIPPPMEVLRISMSQSTPGGAPNMMGMGGYMPRMGGPQAPMMNRIGTSPGYGQYGAPPPNRNMMMQPQQAQSPMVDAARMRAMQMGQPQRQMSGGARTPEAQTAWQSENDLPLRRKMIGKIVSLLQQRKPDAPAEWIRRLPDMARRLEDSLYRTAKNREEYGDFTSLKTRLQHLAVTMGARAQHKASNPRPAGVMPAASGMMPPGMGMNPAMQGHMVGNMQYGSMGNMVGGVAGGRMTPQQLMQQQQRHQQQLQQHMQMQQNPQMRQQFTPQQMQQFQQMHQQQQHLQRQNSMPQQQFGTPATSGQQQPPPQQQQQQQQTPQTHGKSNLEVSDQ